MIKQFIGVENVAKKSNEVLPLEVVYDLDRGFYSDIVELTGAQRFKFFDYENCVYLYIDKPMTADEIIAETQGNIESYELEKRIWG